MAHFAKIENDTVVNVIVISDEYEQDANDYLASIGLEGEWVQTSYNSNIRKKFAGLGDTYDRADDTFKPAQPYPSWIWNSETWGWDTPITPPEIIEGGPLDYRWNEDTLSWEPVE